MALLQVRGLTKYFGSDCLFEDIEFEIHSGEKLGLVGKNGCGKTTLINILTKSEDYDGGDVAWAQGSRFGYLPQILTFDDRVTVYQELRGIFSNLDDLQSKLNEVQEAINLAASDSTKLSELVELQHNLTERFEAEGGYQIEGRIQGVLRGLGLPKERWNDPIAVLSGGERTRLALAGLLLRPHDLLFLDEPTNYLDIEAVEWLEGFLSAYSGAVLVVSHDRFFLDRVVSGFLEIEFGEMKRYRGTYQSYREQKRVEYDNAMKSYLKQNKELERQEKFVRESRATEKSKRKAHSIEKRMSQIERLARPKWDAKAIKIDFPVVAPSSHNVLEVNDLCKSYGNKVLFDKAEFKIEVGEKVGLIGPNGVGKTTLLNMVLGYETADSGSMRLGYEVHPGYFSQLDELISGTPFDHVMAAADMNNTQARTLLGRFLFSGDDVFKSLTDLSGGERRRLGLITLMLSRANFLILDEPTNHLDLNSIEVIEDALKNTNHTVLIVSHDRYFLSRVVSRYIAVIDGKIQSFRSYDEYLYSKTAADAVATVETKAKSTAQQHRENTKEAQRKLRRLERELAEVEAKIEKEENQREEIYKMLNDSSISADYQKNMEMAENLERIAKELEQAYQRWEELQEELENCNYQ